MGQSGSSIASWGLNFRSPAKRLDLLREIGQWDYEGYIVQLHSELFFCDYNNVSHVKTYI